LLAIQEETKVTEITSPSTETMKLESWNRGIVISWQLYCSS